MNKRSAIILGSAAIVVATGILAYFKMKTKKSAPMKESPDYQTEAPEDTELSQKRFAEFRETLSKQEDAEFVNAYLVIKRTLRDGNGEVMYAKHMTSFVSALLYVIDDKLGNVVLPKGKSDAFKEGLIELVPNCSDRYLGAAEYFRQLIAKGEDPSLSKAA